ncbi:uncharacterized protein UV8b_00536 [Ustilaginoidea virens]|uniref:Aminotransferase class I/classII large domain-containing protein n=1 Tax=Ustilaginoidea virens TaxID=1159556 RepID=A0A8E5HIY6_USTVR|nr:uncharacterized protein UV8b_00536 [Ustilaginoidea virens]QUC16295.1 hypothetical protein UV8b_00536 [Ustilaginoidea virens]
MAARKPRLDDAYAAILAGREALNRRRHLTLNDGRLVDFSSNGYLSLSTRPDLRTAYMSRLHDARDAFSLGSCGSRLLDGNSAGAEKLEADVAAFHGAPAGLLFNSGFDANTGLFACAPQLGDLVLYDELIHASVHDGMRLGRATAVPFAHNCVAGADADARGVPAGKSLDEVLRALLDGRDGRALATGSRNVFVAVEAVYSMDGNVAPLRRIVECVEARLPLGNGYVVVDEAHSTGWLGRRGRGLVCHLGLEDRVWARVHTFGKALGCAGAIVLCTPTTRSYLINYARSLIYTTAMGFPTLAAIQTVYYDFLRLGRADPLAADLMSLVGKAHGLLLDLSRRYNHPSPLLRISTAPPESPIIPVFSSQAKSLALHCQKRGYMIRFIREPTVPKGTDRLRLCLHAANTVAEVRGLCMAMEEWLEEQLAEQPAARPKVTELGSVVSTTARSETPVGVISRL